MEILDILFGLIKMNILKLDKIQEFHQLFENGRQERLNSQAAGTRETASTPWKFVQRGEWDEAYEKGDIEGCQAIIVPRVSSESRTYVPMGFIEDDTMYQICHGYLQCSLSGFLVS